MKKKLNFKEKYLFNCLFLNLSKNTKYLKECKQFFLEKTNIRQLICLSNFDEEGMGSTNTLINICNGIKEIYTILVVLKKHILHEISKQLNAKKNLKFSKSNQNFISDFKKALKR